LKIVNQRPHIPGGPRTPRIQCLRGRKIS
jgi:hypothetical protein